MEKHPGVDKGRLQTKDREEKERSQAPLPRHACTSKKELRVANAGRSDSSELMVWFRSKYYAGWG